MSTEALPRTLLTLCLSQAVGAIGLAAGAAAGPLLAEEIGGSSAHGPTAMGALVVGAAVSGPAAAALMRRRGRVPGLAACYLTAALGAVVVILSVSWGFATLLFGSVLLGAGTTGAMLGRYLAADLVAEERRPQAMGLAVGSLTAGAVAGPVLLGPSGGLAESVGLSDLAGLHLIAAVVFPVAALICVPLHRASRGTAPAPADAGLPPKPRSRAAHRPPAAVRPGNCSPCWCWPRGTCRWSE